MPLTKALHARCRPAVLFALILCIGCGSTPPPDPAAEPAAESARPETPPNFVVIVVDDMRFDEMGVVGHPILETPNIDALAASGARFTRAFHAVPLCSPNRASILTGQYPSTHGITDNVARNRTSHYLQTFPRALQAAGYETGFLGKWHMGNDPTARPGFDLWVSIPGQGRTHDPELYEDGEINVVDGYITDILTDRALEFIGKDRDGPFCLYIGHKAIHPDVQQLDDGSVSADSYLGFRPAPRHLGRYDGQTFPQRDNVRTWPADLPGKPALRRALERKHTPEIREMFRAGSAFVDTQETMRRRAEMILAIDEGLGRIVEGLEAAGLLENTAIVFTSDNGYWYDEHALSNERRLPYEESIRTPLIVRYDGIGNPGAKIGELVSSVDLAPTLLDLAGAPIGGHIQGRSLAPLLEGRTDGWRESVLIEFYTYEYPMPWLLDMDYRAIRTKRHKYIHWMQHPDENELYDLESDPYELTNVIDDPAFDSVEAELRAALQAAALEAMGLTR